MAGLLVASEHERKGRRKKGPACLWCGDQRTVRRRRGLCERCYARKGIRRKFPQIQKSGMGATDRDFTGPAPRPPAPTTAEPGTEDKIEEMGRRADQFQTTDHPLDKTLIDAQRAERQLEVLEQLEGNDK
jgi:hypothetical protein